MVYHFYSCERPGRIHNQSGVAGLLQPCRLEPPPETHFIPLEQYGWDEVSRKKNGFFVVYSPDGSVLMRIGNGGNEVVFRYPDGSKISGKHYPWLYYHAEKRAFHHDGQYLDEKPMSGLEEFAGSKRCRLAELVLVPASSVFI